MSGESDRAELLLFGTNIEQQRLREVFHYWNGKRQGRHMPSRADIDPFELKLYLPDLMLIDVEEADGDLRFRYRLVGTGVTHLRAGTSKPDPTSLYVDEVTHHQDLEHVLGHYRRVVAERRPVIDQGDVPPSDKHSWRRFTRLMLPLSTDGRLVNMLLVAVAPSH